MSDVVLCVALSGPIIEPVGASSGRACVVIRFASPEDRDARMLAIDAQPAAEAETGLLA